MELVGLLVPVHSVLTENANKILPPVSISHAKGVTKAILIEIRNSLLRFLIACFHSAPVMTQEHKRCARSKGNTAVAVKKDGMQSSFDKRFCNESWQIHAGHLKTLFCRAGRSTSSLPQKVSRPRQIHQLATVFRIQNTLFFYMCICLYKELVLEDMQKTKKRCLQTGHSTLAPFIPLSLGQSHYPVGFRVDILKVSWKLFYFFQSLLYFFLNSVFPYQFNLY